MPNNNYPVVGAMGVTIHFEGRLRDEDSLDRAVAMATAHADRLGWPIESIDNSLVTLQRVINGMMNVVFAVVTTPVVQTVPVCQMVIRWKTIVVPVIMIVPMTVYRIVLVSGVVIW